MTREPGSEPDVVVDIDVNDEVWIRDHPMTAEDIEDLVEDFHRQGVKTLLIRCGCLGLLPYHTDLSYPISFDGDHARRRPSPVIEDMETYIRDREALNDRYVAVLNACNPPAEFIRAAHGRGMRAIAWIDIFDDIFPGYRSKFLEEHPHCQWVGKDGETYFEGVTDYSWPEARAFRVAQAKELLDLGVDGIHCSMSSHARHAKNTHEIDFYGYSDPVVKAYQEAYDIDILTATEFDTERWHDIKGDAMVQLYRELAEVCHSRSKELWIGMQFGRYTHFAADHHFSTNIVARYSNHWRRIVDEGIADAMIIGDYELATDIRGVYWNTKADMNLKPGEDIFAWAARHYGPHCKGKTRLYLFGEWIANYAETEQFAEYMTFWTNTVLRHGFDGIDMHEAMAFEKHPGGLELLGQMVAAMANAG